MLIKEFGFGCEGLLTDYTDYTDKSECGCEGLPRIHECTRIRQVCVGRVAHNLSRLSGRFRRFTQINTGVGYIFYSVLSVRNLINSF